MTLRLWSPLCSLLCSPRCSQDRSANMFARGEKSRLTADLCFRQVRSHLRRVHFSRIFCYQNRIFLLFEWSFIIDDRIQRRWQSLVPGINQNMCSRGDDFNAWLRYGEKPGSRAKRSGLAWYIFFWSACARVVLEYLAKAVWPVEVQTTNFVDNRARRFVFRLTFSLLNFVIIEDTSSDGEDC